MKKVYVFSVLFAAVTLVGSAFAILGNGGNKSDAALSSQAVLVPEDVEGGVKVAVDSGDYRRCGSQASRCGSSSSSGGCCGSSGTGATAGADVEQLRKRLQAHYSKSLDGEITVDVKQFGCHQEAEIRQDNRVIKRLSISGGQITEIT
jgi:hypothetical protein